ncbi:hypothetical protein [Brevibacterium sp. FME37]|uniref:hypothetical protein n=1 Tax=Brevibacterium sp. FME37 TaxID=2742607 RepID=UPI0018693129|nr:hypothetical protein [Brevibacterium sp. FME37]
MMVVPLLDVQGASGRAGGALYIQVGMYPGVYNVNNISIDSVIHKRKPVVVLIASMLEGLRGKRMGGLVAIAEHGSPFSRELTRSNV